MKTSPSLRLLLNDFGNNKRLFSKKSQSCTLPPNDCLLLHFTGFEISFSLWWNKGFEHIYLFYLVERSFEITKMPFVYPRCDKWIKECYKNETHHVTSFQIMTKFWKAISILTSCNNSCIGWCVTKEKILQFTCTTWWIKYKMCDI